MLTGWVITRSASARALLLASVGVTLAILGWTSYGDTWIGIPLSTSFYYLFAVLDKAGAVAILLVPIGAALIARPGWLRPVGLWVNDHVHAIALFTVLALSAGTLLVYHNHRLSMDEYAAYFQSQVFATGHLTGRFPPALLDSLIPPVFQNYFLCVARATGAVASAYWPSFALLLTPFTWLGAPWLCNPIISGLTLLAIHRLALRLFEDREAAGLAVLLTAASPVFFADGISYYSMPAHLLANTVYALLLLQPTPRKALLAGVVGSIALTLHNPAPHFLFALPWLLWVARQPQAGRLILCLGAGYLPLSVLLGIGWYEFIHILMRAGAAPGHDTGTLGGDVSNTLDSAFSLPAVSLLYARAVGMAKVWVWAVPGIMILAAAGAWKLRHQAQCRVLFWSAVSTLLGYLLVPVDQGHGWGFRYFHPVWMVLPILAAGALTRSRATGANDGFATEDVRVFVTACALVTLVVGIGQRAAQISQFITDDLSHLPYYAGPERQVMFVNTQFFYAIDLVQNDPLLRGNILMVSHGPTADAELMREQFPRMQRASLGPHGSVWVIPADKSVVQQP